MVAHSPTRWEDDVRIIGPAQSFSTLISGGSVMFAHLSFQIGGGSSNLHHRSTVGSFKWLFSDLLYIYYNLNQL